MKWTTHEAQTGDRRERMKFAWFPQQLSPLTSDQRECTVVWLERYVAYQTYEITYWRTYHTLSLADALQRRLEGKGWTQRSSPAAPTPSSAFTTQMTAAQMLQAQRQLSAQYAASGQP